MNDLRFAFRQLLKNPGFTAVAVLTLALGIGANTAIFSVVYAVVLRPLPFPDSERLVTIWTRSPFFRDARGPMAAANHRDLLAQNTVFEDIAILREFPPANYNLSGDGDPERLQGARIAANLLPMLGVRPALGRGFTDDETKPGQDGVVLLSHGLWQRRFAGDPGIVGKTIRLDAGPHTVVGVMGPGFQFPSREFQIRTPLTINPADFRTRLGNYHRAVARLKPGVSVVEAQAEIDLDIDERPQVYWNCQQRARDRMAMVVPTAQSPDSPVPAVLAAIRSVDPDQAPYAVRAMTEVLDQSVASRWLNAVLFSVFAGVSLLLASMGLFGVIAWMVNRRTRELGIRVALGAQKRDVLGLVLRQGMKMAGRGIVIGFVGALALTRLLESLLFGVGPTDPVTFAIIPTLLFGVALLACWLPARRASNVDPMEALRYE